MDGFDAALLAVAVGFLGVLVVRALLFREKRGGELPDLPEIEIDSDAAVGDLAEMIRCRTVAYSDESLIDEGEFDRFRALLPRLYPTVYERCALTRVGKSGLLFHWKGRKGGDPAVLMAHYDVVPVDEGAWKQPPFGGVIADGALWGRGALDTKGTVMGVLRSAETLMRAGYTPERDFYFAFAGDEETSMEVSPMIVAELERRGVKPAFVLDEGGFVVDGAFLGAPGPAAMVGIAEKGMLAVSLALEGAGGHASSPPPHSAVGRLARAVVDIENRPFRARISPPVRALFDSLGRRASFPYRLVFANLWCFGPLLGWIGRRTGGEFNALMRTTCAFTMMEGSRASNVMPTRATVGADLRVISGDSIALSLERLRRRIKDREIKIEDVFAMEPSRVSKTGGPEFAALANAIRMTFPGALVAPYLMIGGSDARQYDRISEHVYRFWPAQLTKAERATIHGNDERIALDKIAGIVRFYVRLIRLLG